MKLPQIIKIPGVHNFRDIGGYSGLRGTIAPGRFFRSAALNRLEPPGLGRLESLGVGCVIDLRSTREAKMQPDALGCPPRFRYCHLPMLDHIQSNFASGDFSIFPENLSDMYCSLLEDSAGTFRRVFEIILEEENAVLYHCTAGKDRTGLVTMLLLDLAGVGGEAICEDYSLSEKLLPNEPLEKYHPDFPRYLFESRPETLRAALGFLHREFGGAAGYLEAAGFSSASRLALIKKLC